MKYHLFIILLLYCIVPRAQQTTLTPEQINALTPDSKGERSADGRPHVPVKLLSRLNAVRLVEAWGILRN